jgi:hypothetical protein
MAKTPTFKRLPAIWKTQDTLHILERYLGVMDRGFDRVNDAAKTVMDFRSPDKVPDRFLALFGEKVGHRWRSDRSYTWNRRRIVNAIARYSYKGTTARIADIVYENGGEYFRITDNASRLCVLSRQGQLSRGNCHIQSADYFHDGAFVLEVDQSVDLAGLEADLAETLAGGERWYINLLYQPEIIEDPLNTDCIQTIESGIGAGSLDSDLPLSFWPTPEPQHIFWPVQWSQPRRKPGTRDKYLSFRGDPDPVASYSPIVWSRPDFRPDSDRQIGRLSLSFDDSDEPRLELDEQLDMGNVDYLSMDGAWTMDRADLFFTGLDFDAALVQDDPQITIT